MEKFIPYHYYQLIEKASAFHNLKLPPTEELLRDTEIQKSTLGSLNLLFVEPLFYIADYTRNKYLYLDKGVKTLLGYEIENMKNAGPTHWVSSLFHPNDCKIFNEKILPEALQFLKAQPPFRFCNLSFSFNYRMRTAKGHYLVMLQRSTYYLGNNGQPLAAVGFAVDISDFKPDTSIIHTVERIDRDFTSLSKTPLLRSVYYPDKELAVLSKREIEILKYIALGKSSKEIADLLFISINTVNNHRRNMLEKTGTKNSVGLIAFAKNYQQDFN